MFFLILYEVMTDSPQTARACESFPKAGLHFAIHYANKTGSTLRFALLNVHIFFMKYIETILRFPIV